MEDFRRQFLTETVATLENLHRNLSGAEAFSDASRREVFRVLHTVKGTAQTFGYTAAGRLAHELETLLAGGENSQTALLEGIELLRQSLTEEEFQIPEKFAGNHPVIPNTRQKTDETDNFSLKIPSEFYSQLSNQERNIATTAARDGKNLFVLEAVFELINFAEGLINFREKLNSLGEIIAVLPGEKQLDGKIGFLFLTTGSEETEVSTKDAAKIVWKFSREKPTNDIGAVLREITRHGEEIALKLGKQIEFKTSSDEAKFSAAELRFIFEIFLHLVRNAVDHAVERVGKIIIRIKKEGGGLRLSIADDGRGIDSETIKARAIERNLIAADADLSETDVINLIFQPEFSMKSESNEISGRGIGLDAVQSAVRNFGGHLSVVSEKEKGTTFEIFLPR